MTRNETRACAVFLSSMGITEWQAKDNILMRRFAIRVCCRKVCFNDSFYAIVRSTGVVIRRLLSSVR